MPASQEFRDGAAYGALELARRLKVVTFFGFPLSVPNIELAAKEIQTIMGGRTPDLVPAETYVPSIGNDEIEQALRDGSTGLTDGQYAALASTVGSLVDRKSKPQPRDVQP